MNAEDIKSLNEPPNEVVEQVTRAVGAFVLNWNLVETILDTWIAIIYQTAGGRDIRDTIPWPLEDKLKFLRRCLNKIESLSAHKEQKNAILQQVNEIKEIRHTIVHGFLSKYQPKTREVVFVKFGLTPDKTMHKQIPKMISISEIVEKAALCQQLAAEMCTATESLMKTFVPDAELTSYFEATRPNLKS